MVLLLSFVMSVVFSVEKSHAFQGHFEDYDSIIIIDLIEEKCVPPRLDPLFEGEGNIEGIEVCYNFISRSEIERCLVDLGTGERECENLTPLSIAGEVLGDTNKIERVQSFLSEVGQSEDLALTEENEALISEIQDLLSGLRFASSQQERLVSGLRSNFLQDDENFDELKNDIDLTTQGILSAAEFGGGLVIARITADLSHKLSPVPGTQKVVMPDQTRRGLLSRTARGGVRLTKNLLSVTGWLRRVSKVFVIYSVAGPSIRAWKIFKREEDPGIAPVIPLVKDGINFVEGIPDRITLFESKDTSN